MNLNNEVDQNLLRELSLIKQVAPRNPQIAAKGAANFIDEARKIAFSVSVAKKARHIGVKNQEQKNSFFHRKERLPMLNTIATIMLVISLVLGSGVATVAASQDSQPGDLLYDVKLASEDAALNLTGNPQKQLDLSLEYVANRADEILTTLIEGDVPGDNLMIRYKAQIEQAMTIAAGLGDDDAITGLEKLQTQLESEYRVFMQVQTNAPVDSEGTMEQIRLMLEERIRLVETGQTNLLMLREQLQTKEQLSNPDVGQQGSENGQGGQDLVPTTGQGNPWAEGTPTPGSSYGPGQGTGDCGTCTCTPSANGQGSNSGTSSNNYLWLTLTPMGQQNGKK